MGVVIGETTIIGDDCTLYHGVTLGGTSWSAGKRHPTLGDNVVVGAGAKILGPVNIGDNSRIGSNAVVLKGVPSGATVVGIPGRVIESEPSEVNARRTVMANKLGFDAYGSTQEMPDPIVQSINKILDHMHYVDERISQMSDKISAMDGSELPPLESSLDISDAEVNVPLDDGTNSSS